MKITPTVSLLAAAVFTMLAGTASAQVLTSEQIVPIAVNNSGFTGDAILAGGTDGITIDVAGNPNTSTSTNTYEYASAAYGSANGFTGYQLPDNGTITTGSGSVFQLQPYTGNNLLVVKGTSQTLTLTTPGIYTDVSLLLNQPNGNPDASSFTFNFSNGTSLTLGVGTIPYWVGGIPTSTPPNVTAGVGVEYQPLEIHNDQDGTPINFDEYDFSMGVDKYKTLTSVTVNGGNQTLDIFAVSGTVGQAPEPSTWAMMIGGIGALFFVGRMRRNRNSVQI